MSLLPLILWIFLPLGLALGPGLASLAIHQKSFDHPVLHDSARLSQRSSNAAVPLTNKHLYYVAELGFGANQQQLPVVVDTGSSDLWIMGGPANEAQAEAQAKSKYPFRSFDYQNSTSFHRNDSSVRFRVRYRDQTMASGFWASDTLWLGNTSVDQASFGVATFANLSLDAAGILGLGPAFRESTNSPGLQPSHRYTYANFPQLLVDRGITSRNVFSLYLNAPKEGLGSASGMLLFGGIDHDRYQGTLTTVPVLGVKHVLQYKKLVKKPPVRMNIMLNSVSLNNSQDEPMILMKGNVGVLLDSGSTFCHLPKPLVASIARAIGAKPLGSYYQVDCDSVQTRLAGSLKFSFSGQDIEVPIADMIMRVPSRSGASHCVLGIRGRNDLKVLTLGDTFLRSAYVVFDLDRFEVSLAQARHDVSSGDSHIEAITNNVPRALRASTVSSMMRADKKLWIHRASEGYSLVRQLPRRWISRFLGLGAWSREGIFSKGKCKGSKSCTDKNGAKDRPPAYKPPPGPPPGYPGTPGSSGLPGPGKRPGSLGPAMAGGAAGGVAGAAVAGHGHPNDGHGHGHDHDQKDTTNGAQNVRVGSFMWALVWLIL